MSNGIFFRFSHCNYLRFLPKCHLNMSSVGERIKEQRLRLNWTQEKLAAEAKMSTGFLSDLETGKRNVSAEYLLEISHALGVSLDYLMKGDASKPKAANIQVPASLSDFAKQAQLSFAQTLMLLDMQRQIIAHRSHTKTDDLEKVDWRSFYESVKPFLK
jgi:transcriptional regulator with XRE-family HTH domain